MRLHIVKSGETFESIATAYLYQPAKASDIKRVNNTNVIYAGQVLKIPDLFEGPKINPEFERAGLVINGSEINSTPSIVVTRAFDSIAGTFDFTLPTDDYFKDLSSPYSYQDVDIYHKSDLILSGQIYNITKDLGKTASTVYSGFQKPGMLSQVNMPDSMYPRTFYKTSLKTIAEKICNAFQIVVVIDDNAKSKANEKFDKTAPSPNEYMGGYLIDLAQQKGLILSSTPEGALRISVDAIKSKDPILNLVNPEGDISFDGSKVYSDFTALRAGNTKRSPAQAKAKLDIDIFRQKVIQQIDRFSDSISNFVKSEVIRAMLDSFTFSVKLPYVRTLNGDLIDVNSIITVESKDHSILKPTDFIVRKCTYNFKTSSDSCNIDLIPLDWYQGKFTKFWE